MFAQADVSSSTLKGKVVDQSDAAVTGATITVISSDRGVARRVISDEEGMYRVPVLRPGVYQVRTAAPGFQPQMLKNLILTVGQVADVDVHLQVGTISQELEVTARPPLIETERSQQSDTVERKQIVSLPNLSRSLTSYIFLLPGVTDAAAARIQQSRAIGISTSGFSVGGGNGRGNYVSIDGGENDSGTGNLRIRNLSVEAVQEFRVNRSAFSAEYGFTAYSSTDVVTRSGGDRHRGSAYIFYRSEKISARDPFNMIGTKAPEHRISPGFTLSGPLLKKKVFFFSSFETLGYSVTRLRSYTSNPALLEPTGAQAAYIQTLTSGPSATDLSRRIAVQLTTALSTASYPMTLRMLHESEGRFRAPTHNYNWTTRIDHEHGKRNIVNGHFTLAREDADLLGTANTEAPSDGIIQKADDYTVVGTWTHIVNDHLLNQVRVQFASDDYRQISRAPMTTQIQIAGLITYGRLGTVPFIIDQNRYQFDDSLTWTRGPSEFKFGISYRPNNALMITEIGFQGTFQFAAGLPLTRALSAGTAAMLTGPLAPPADTTLTSVQAFNFGLPSNWQQGFGTPGFKAWQQNLGSFGQVSWKATARLTLNLGARLDYDGEPKPLDHNVSISPRVGFAWDPFGKGETVIRGGFGTYYAPVSLNVILAATLMSDSGQYINSTSRSLQDGAQSSQALWAYGVGLGKLPFATLTEQNIRAFGIMPSPGQPNRRLTGAADDYDNPYTVQASFGINRQLGRTVAADLSFQMFHGVHLPVALEGNYRESGELVTVPGMPGSDLFGPRLMRIDPSIAQKVVHSSEGNSIYYGGTASLLKRFGNGFDLRASYTYSKALDDTTDFNGGLTPYLPTRRYLERGLSSFDVRHSFVTSGTFVSPFKDEPDSNWLEHALANITVSPIVVLRSGLPFNLFIGRDVNGDLNTTDRPFHAPRNSGIGENYYSADLRLSKRIHFGHRAEGRSLELIAEATNILNHVNYLRVNDIVCGTTAQPGFIAGCDPKFLTGPFDFRGISGLPPTAPLGFVSAAPSRQIQFGLKFEM